MPAKTKPRKAQTTRGKARESLQSIRVVKVGNEQKLLLRQRLNMTREMFSRVVDVSPRAIATVEAKQGEVTKLRRPYAEVARLYEALSEVVEPEAIGPWFVTPNPAFGGLKPLEVVERGEIDRLWDMAHRLQYGMPG